MNKKTIVIILVAVVVVGGGYYGINRWRRAGGLSGVLIGGGGKLANLIGQETAKEEARQKAEEAQEQADEAEEAAKTPEDRYNETKEVTAYDANSKAAASEIKEIVEKVFGKAKLTSVAADTVDTTTVTMMDFEIARLATGDDLSALNKALTDKGLPIIQSMIDNKSAILMAGSDESGTYAFGFEIGGQTVGASIIKTKQ